MELHDYTPPRDLIDAFGRHRFYQAALIERPIFIFASGERCGSTLIQRLLCTHPDIFIWGEQRGALTHLLSFYVTATEHAIQNERVGELFIESGTAEFIANLNPGISSIKNATRAAIRTLFGGYAERWGCKEVRCGVRVARLITELFPNSKIVFLVRHVSACLASLIRWEYDVAACKEFVDRWTSLAEEMTRLQRNDIPQAILLRYEDFIAEPLARTERLCSFLDIDISRLDLGTLKLRIADHSNVERLETVEPRTALPLPPEVKALTQADNVREVLSMLSYEI